ncbi:YveK family protein [Chengkuizengella axinellae]|uniref:Wzz/FepE/Etk N-terminal domain-containing protein n=1 Tax=Chengkuizengella axinellae TaxID=3064388 RepID=A0ABT9IZE1_9BACL|nr:Wzz/FepE/Etk N-terminal domain-containing protein [Chengkuizengella sp. 2205SS18-9]MDP5274749.1 Wzz/FepE/Etk N-terminal domain-containing protein [Chengkuizengella sp. 2205SS18-9]
MEETISLKENYEIVKKRIWLILSITIIAALISALVSLFVLTPIYQSSTQILVNNSESEISGFDINDIRTNTELISTYSVIIKSPAILDIVIEELELNRSSGVLSSQINVKPENNSQVVSIIVQDANPTLAAEIANTIARVFKTEIVALMNVDNVSVLAEATVSEKPSPIKPNPTLNIAIAIVVGLMSGVGLSFLLEYLDNTVKTEQDVEKLLELPVLGSISQIKEQEENAFVSSQQNQPVGSVTIES